MSGQLYEFEGEQLSVKTIAGKVQLAPSTIYKYLKEGFSIHEAVDAGKTKSNIVFKNRKKTNNRTARKYPYLDGEYTVSELSALEEVSADALYRRLKHGMSPEEAIREIKKNIAKKYPFRRNFLSAYKISIITGVPRLYLLQELDSDREYTEEEVEQVVSSYNRRDILMIGDISLFQYCLKHQYNYNVIYHAVKKNGLSVEDAILQYIEEGQRQVFPYTFALGNILLCHFCIKEKLDNRYVNAKIHEGNSVEEAIIAAIFLDSKTCPNRSNRNLLYTSYLERGIEVLQENLSASDKKFIMEKHNQVIIVLKHYHLYQAVSILSSGDLLEEDRKVLLKRLQLTEQDLIDCSEDIFDGFIKRTSSINEIEPIAYTWRGCYQKTR